MSYLEIVDQNFGFFDAESVKEKGSELRETYASADPFPHIKIDDFCSPEILDHCISNFPENPDPDSKSFDRGQEKFKTSFNPDFLSPTVRSFFYSMNSRPFLSFLENMTGIDRLIADPYFMGGGFHQTTNGGHLDVHADFNLHPRLRIERRLNLLIYLNKDWDESYGGCLELWDQDMNHCVKKIEPMFNRCVVFSTTGDSFHGHPIPVAHPREAPRRSIALYYYTATWDGTSRSATTQFKKRPNSDDKTDWGIKRSEIMTDLLPPILDRNLKKISRKLKR